MKRQEHVDDSGFILRTAETWKRHDTLANVYSEQLSYFVFGSVSRENVHLPENLVEAILESSSRQDVDLLYGFSLATDHHKIIFSDEVLLFASREE